MKKTKKVLSLVMVLVMMFSVTAFAEVETVGVTYPGGENVYFTISNVTGIWGTMEMYEAEYNVYETNSTATITLSNDGYAIFQAQKLTEEKGNFNFTDEIVKVSSGQVTVWVPDETGKLDDYGYPLFVEKTVDASELSNYEYDIPGYSAGNTITLTEPGFYYVVYQPEAVEGIVAFVRVFEPENTEAPTKTEEVSSTVTALATSSPVLVNGEEKSFEAYNIDGYNYFKLRDLALALTGSEKQFNVQWDNEKNAINLISNEAYTTVGGEMAAGDGETKTGILNTSAIYKDGVEVKLTAYNINGNNYFKLRDLMDAFNIEVTWDNDTQTIGISTINLN